MHSDTRLEKAAAFSFCFLLVRLFLSFVEHQRHFSTAVTHYIIIIPGKMQNKEEKNYAVQCVCSEQKNRCVTALHTCENYNGAKGCHGGNARLPIPRKMVYISLLWIIRGAHTSNLKHKVISVVATTAHTHIQTTCQHS